PALQLARSFFLFIRLRLPLGAALFPSTTLFVSGLRPPRIWKAREDRRGSQTAATVWGHVVCTKQFYSPFSALFASPYHSRRKPQRRKTWSRFLLASSGWVAPIRSTRIQQILCQ